MIRIGRCSVIGIVTPKAGVRSIVVIVVLVASSTANGFVGTFQYVVFVVIEKSSRIPPRVGGVALRTIC